MKKILTLAFLLTLSCSLSAQTSMVRLTRFEGQNIRGIDANSGFRVEIYPSDSTYALVELPKDMEEYLVFTINSQGTVKIGLDYPGFSRRNVDRFFRKKNRGDFLRAKVYMKSLDRVVVSGGSNLNGNGHFKASDTFIITGSGSRVTGIDIESRNLFSMESSSGSGFEGKVSANEFKAEFHSASRNDLEIQANKAEFDLSSAARADVRGHADDLDVEAYSSAQFAGGGLTARKAELESSSAANITVGEIAESLDVEANSASVIRYSGSPAHLNVRSSSAASVRKQ